MISKYIKDLIPNNSRIIIPDFGAFMIQDTPTGKLISFNDFLKFNDSVLLNRIITVEKVDAAKGKEEIKAYIAEIEAAFKSGESFAVEGVGYLSKDSQNNINFVQDENAKDKGKPKAAAKPKAEEAKLAAAPAAEAKAETPKAEAPKAPATEPKPQPAAAPKPQTSAPQPSATPKSTYINNSYTNKNMEIKTKDKTLTTVLIIVAAVVILGVLIWLAIDFNWFGPFKTAKEAPAPVEVVVDTTPAVDTTAYEEPEPEPVIVEEPVDPSSMHYHIIAGSFQVESNAIRFQEDMRSRGYNAVILTRGTGYHYVSVKAFDSRSEAVAEWRNMTLDNPNLWILVK